MSQVPAVTDEEAIVLERMAASRTALLASRYALPAAPTSRHPGAMNVGDLIVRAPRVTLLLALCVSAIVLGPRRTAAVAGRTGALAWLGVRGHQIISKLI